MIEFEENKNIYEKAKRSTYVIFPLKHDNIDLINLKIENSTGEDFFSNDLTDFLQFKFRKESGFVRRFRLSNNIQSLRTKEDEIVPVLQTELFVFNNGIAFLAILLQYENTQANFIYDLVQPGYINSQNKSQISSMVSVIDTITVNGKNNLFRIYASSKEMSIKESYLFNATFVNKRFRNLNTLNKITFNVHKLIDISKKFIDISEKDIKFAYGARDVEKGTYRWGACISSQSISYAYAIESDENNFSIKDIIDNTQEDLVLTLLVLHQKLTCQKLNETLYDILFTKKNSNYFKRIGKIKEEVLEFRATGILAPSQISRWNNVCETYRYLVLVNGIDEALVEIEQKVNIIKNDEENKATKLQGNIANFIAVFGLISIISSILEVVGMLIEGNSVMHVAFILSSTVMIIFAALWYFASHNYK